MTGYIESVNQIKEYFYMGLQPTWLAGVWNQIDVPNCRFPVYISLSHANRKEKRYKFFKIKIIIIIKQLRKYARPRKLRMHMGKSLAA